MYLFNTGKFITINHECFYLLVLFFTTEETFFVKKINSWAVVLHLQDQISFSVDGSYNLMLIPFPVYENMEYVFT